jgi:hypothetical protein
MSSSDWVQTRDQIIFRAFRISGVIPDDQTISAQKLAAGVTAFNALSKVLQRRGKKLWLNSSASLNTVIATDNYTVAADVLDIADIWIPALNVQVPLVPVQDWLAIPDRSTAGQPTTAYWDRANKKLYLYPVPDAAYAMTYQKTRRLYDFDEASDEPDFPQHWIQALTFALAADLSAEYQMPVEERRDLRAVAAGYIDDAEEIDMPAVDESGFVKGAY